MDKLTTLYLKHRGSHGLRLAYLGISLGLFGLGLLGIYRPNPDCHTGCGLI